MSKFPIYLPLILCLKFPQTTESFVSSPLKSINYNTKLYQQGLLTRKSGARITTPLYASEKDVETSPTSPEQALDKVLSERRLKEAISVLQQNPNVEMTKIRLQEIFDTIEYRTAQKEENILPLQEAPNAAIMAYPPTSKSRTEMTEMYKALKSLDCLRLFGACNENTGYPAAGSKLVTPTMLETITRMSMSSLTPKNSGNNLLLAGVGLAVLEGILSMYTGIDVVYFVLATLAFVVVDKLVVNGASVEFITKLFYPEYSQRIVRHEAGHFLMAYLMGCPVEGCVLSSIAAMKDYRFGGPFTSVSAGTSFFDEDLSKEVNGISPLKRASIDRFSIIVMAGIAAEAIAFGRADGGAGDEQSLITFLTQINPRGGGAKVWDGELIRNQARWAAVQAVLLIEKYKPAYDALVDALERGGNLGACIYAIEKAARDYNLQPLSHPDGFIIEKNGGLFSDWVLYEDQNKERLASATSSVPTHAQQGTLSVPSHESIVQEAEEKLTSEEFLRKYREEMQRKLEFIEEQAKSLEEK